jgi:hypothetical protein
MNKFAKIEEKKNVELTDLKVYSDKIRDLMVRKRLRKYGNIGQT